MGNKMEAIDNEFNGNYSAVIHRDLGRNAYPHWNKTADYSDFQKNYDLSQIAKLVNIVFTESTDLHYVQSFDSVIALFYLISNGNLYVAKKIIVPYLYIFRSDLATNCDGFSFLTNNLWPLLKKYDAVFCKWLKSMTFGGEQDISFVVEWYISWFAHSSINDFALILRVYDYMISTQEQHIGLYMLIAVLLTNKQKLKQNVKEPSDLIHFTRNKMEFNSCSVQKLIKKCHGIMVTEMRREKRSHSWPNQKWKTLKKKSKKFGIYL